MIKCDASGVPLMVQSITWCCDQARCVMFDGTTLRFRVEARNLVPGPGDDYIDELTRGIAVRNWHLHRVTQAFGAL